MNIFLLDNDIKKSAQYIDDVRLKSTINELCQVINANFNKAKCCEKGIVIGHINHPVTLWYNSLEGVNFLLNYGLELCGEYLYRFKKIHQNYYTILGFKKSGFINDLPKNKEFSPATQVTNKKMSTDISEIRCYVAQKDKKYPMKWTGREVPTFFCEL